MSFTDLDRALRLVFPLCRITEINPVRTTRESMIRISHRQNLRGFPIRVAFDCMVWLFEGLAATDLYTEGWQRRHRRIETVKYLHLIEECRPTGPKPSAQNGQTIPLVFLGDQLWTFLPVNALVNCLLAWGSIRKTHI